MLPRPDRRPPEVLLREAGLRVTAVRVAVLQELAAHPHLPAEAVITSVRERIGHVSRQGAYDALRGLEDACLLRRIEPAGSPARYELRVGDNHHHVVCRHCGTVSDVDCAVGLRPCLQPSETHGFALDEAEVTFWGICPACQANPPPSKGTQ